MKKNYASACSFMRASGAAMADVEQATRSELGEPRVSIHKDATRFPVGDVDLGSREFIDCPSISSPEQRDDSSAQARFTGGSPMHTGQRLPATRSITADFPPLC